MGGPSLPAEAPGTVRRATFALATLFGELAGLYQLGGLLGILVGFAASVVAVQTRKLGR